MRVIDWILDRVEGKVDANETAIGYLPKPEDINLTGIEDEVSLDTLKKLLDVDADLWKKEVAQMRDYYAELTAGGAHIPQALYDVLDKIEAKLG